MTKGQVKMLVASFFLAIVAGLVVAYASNKIDALKADEGA